jgi:hypothetical protein
MTKGKLIVSTSPAVSEVEVTIPQSLAAPHPKTNDVPRVYGSLSEGLTEFNKMFCYVVNANGVVDLRDFEAYKPDPFVKHQFNNWLYEQRTKDETGKDVTKYPPIAPKWFTHRERLQRKRMTYAPGKERWEIPGALNRWRGLGSKPVQGDIRLWNELLAFLIPSETERRYFKQWVACPIQRPGTKLKTAVVLWSELQGVGKNLLFEPVQRIYGLNQALISEDELFGKFGSCWQLDKQFIIGDEVQGAHDKFKTIERVKLLITAPEIWSEEKYKPKFCVPNTMNFAFLTNNPDPFYIAEQDRRFWIWEIPQTERLSDEFYAKFAVWKDSAEGIAALHYHLLHEVDMTGFHPHAAAPMTASKELMIEINRSELDRWVRDLIDVSPGLYPMDELLEWYRGSQERKGLRPKDGSPAMTKALKRAGCKLAHNGKQVRIGNGTRPTLWVVADPASPEAQRWLSIGEAAELAAEYEAQAGRRRVADFCGVRAPETVRDTEVALTEQKVN